MMYYLFFSFFLFLGGTEKKIKDFSYNLYFQDKFQISLSVRKCPSLLSPQEKVWEEKKHFVKYTFFNVQCTYIESVVCFVVIHSYESYNQSLTYVFFIKKII